MSFSILKQSIGIAVNRNILQLASIVITALLGLANELVLAQFSLALSYAAIFFVMVSFIQLGLLSEFTRLYAEKNYHRLYKLFYATSVCILLLSAFFIFKIWIFPHPFIKSDVNIKYAACDALRILTISLPFVGLLTTITYFLESTGESNKVTQLRIIQFFLQISLVLLALWFKPYQFKWINISDVAWVAGAYVLSDVVMCLMGGRLFLIQKNKLSSFSVTNNNSVFDEIKKIIKFGFPVMLGVVGQKSIFYFCTDYCSILGVWQTFAFTTINSIVALLQIPLTGLSNLLTIKISLLRGEKKLFTLDKLTNQYRNLYVLETTFLVFILYFFYGNIITIFSIEKQTLQNMLEIKPYVILFFIMNLMLTFNMGALRGFSDNFVPQVILLGLLAFGVLPWIIFPLNINFVQMLLFFIVSGSAASGILFIRLREKIKENNYCVSNLN